jgi:23S rRNA (uracil1939-C5)-methyltransferase
LKAARFLDAPITDLSHDGRGVARIDGKVYFVDGALPGEEVRFRVTGKRRGHGVGVVETVIRASPDRVPPPCSHFGVCGGCSLQHLSADAQVRFKAQGLKESLARLGEVAPEVEQAPITGPQRHYRRKARLGIRFVPKKGGVLLGFRERRSSYITPLAECHTLDTRVVKLLPTLRELVASLTVHQRLPQIEVACGDDIDDVALVFRHLEPLTSTDCDQIQRYARDHQVRCYLQSGGLETVQSLDGQAPSLLTYRLDEGAVTIRFRPTDFAQVNGEINRRMVDNVISLLAPTSTDRVLDLFCGVGNFSLPIARRAGAVFGVEGDAALVDRARDNAKHNGLSNTTFETADLSDPDTVGVRVAGGNAFNKWLLDPPRSGAIDLVKAIPQTGSPARIVYVSCNPSTLARDANVLCHVKGYRLERAGIIDMFPNTAHVESIALFVRAD